MPRPTGEDSEQVVAAEATHSWSPVTEVPGGDLQEDVRPEAQPEERP